MEPSELDIVMVCDAMNAILLSECTEFIKTYSDPFAFSTRAEITKITDNMQYTGHSGCSFALTLRMCQYYFNNPDLWEEHKRMFYSP